MLLEKNDMKFVGKGSRFIGIKCFFIINKIQDNERKFMYCPTDNMTTDVYTEFLQESLFIKHRDSVLGIT